MNEAQEYLDWKADFSWQDDGVAAFLALKAVEKVRFELATRGGGYIGRIEEAVAA